MRFLPRICLLLTLTGLTFAYTEVANAFIVKAITIEGLQGVSQATVLNYLPIQVGQDYEPTQSSSIINSLYTSGLFSNVSLSQQGNTLVVHVVERPIISSIQVTGNTALPKDKLDDVLKKLGLVQGQVFDNSILTRIVHSLQSEYDSLGKYNVTVIPSVTPEPRNRVAVKIDINEGRTVIIKQIDFIGNQAFSSWRLRQQLSMTTPRPWSFLTHGDQYNDQKVQDSLQALRNYYLDHGYLRFKIDSVQSTLTPDRNYVYIVIHITEGPIYTVKGYQLAGNLIVPESELTSLINIKPGSVYSQQAVNDATQAVTKLLGDMGYLFASVNMEPQIDDANKQAFLTFYVDPGTRTYIRRINFSGNTKTEDVVLRRELRQMEGGLASTSDIQESDRQLNLTGYLDSLNPQTVPVPGVPDQVDLDYNLTEAPSASATAGLGYGTLGWVVNAGINQPNFLGTGNSLGLNFSNSLYSTAYSLTYNNPYYTPDGVQRGFTLFDQYTTPGNVNLASYTTNTFGGSVNYSIPISAQGDNLQLGYGYQNTLLKVGSTPSIQFENFVQTYGRHFNEALLNLGWSRNGLDKAVFPTKGIYQSFGLQVALPADDDSLYYYKTNYNADIYYPLVDNYIVTMRGDVGYGEGFASTHELPFFANYYAGGIGTSGEVRGFQANTLGPKDSNGEPLGGNELVSGTLGLIVPNPIDADRVRTTLFLDGGNVYSNTAAVTGGTGAGPVRFATGLAVDWRVPVMNVLLELSVAKALNPQPGDDTRLFDFNVGTSF